MAQVNDTLCDECGVTTTPRDRVVVHVGSDYHAGYVLDFCKACASGIIDSEVIQRAMLAFEQQWGLMPPPPRPTEEEHVHE